MGRTYGERNMVEKYIPKQGDICYMDFSPTKGHEQTGLRPVVVISKETYNRYTNMVVLCPISSNSKPFVAHYKLNSTKKIFGSVLCEHIRSVDYRARNLYFVEKIDEEDLREVIDIVSGFIEINN